MVSWRAGLNANPSATGPALPLQGPPSDPEQDRGGDGDDPGWRARNRKQQKTRRFSRVRGGIELRAHPPGVDVRKSPPRDRGREKHDVRNAFLRWFVGTVPEGSAEEGGSAPQLFELETPR